MLIDWVLRAYEADRDLPLSRAAGAGPVHALQPAGGLHGSVWRACARSRDHLRGEHREPDGGCRGHRRHGRLQHLLRDPVVRQAGADRAAYRAAAGAVHPRLAGAGAGARRGCSMLRAARARSGWRRRCAPSRSSPGRRRCGFRVCSTAWRSSATWSIDGLITQPPPARQLALGRRSALAWRPRSPSSSRAIRVYPRPSSPRRSGPWSSAASTSGCIRCDCRPIRRSIRFTGRSTAPVATCRNICTEQPLRVLRGWRTARRLPAGTGAARSAWLADLRRDPSRNRLRRFGQAMVLAAELPADVGWLHAHFLHTPASVTRYAARLRRCRGARRRTPRTSGRRRNGKSAKSWPTAAGWSPAPRVNARHLAALAPEAERVELLYHGLDFSRFPPPAERRPARDGGDPDEPVVLLSVGRAVAKKGYDVLLEALARLPRGLALAALAHRRRSAARPICASAHASWALSAASTGGALGRSRRCLQAYRAADLFVLACRIADDGDRDGLPNVLMEAQSQGLGLRLDRRLGHSRADHRRRDRRARAAGRSGRAGARAGSADPLSRPTGSASGRRACGASAVVSPSTGGIDRLAGRFGASSSRSSAMRIAFYAPMKPAADPVPSGDRTMARLLMAALTRAGHVVEPCAASAALMATAMPARQRRIAALGGELARSAGAPMRRSASSMPARALVHLPPLSQGAGLAGTAGQRSAWHSLRRCRSLARGQAGDRSLGAGVRRGGVGDRPRRSDPRAELRRRRGRPCLACRSTPALPRCRRSSTPGRYALAQRARDANRRRLCERYGIAAGEPLLLTVAMMRPGDKLASYRLLGEALASLQDRPWRLLVAGDGPARARGAPGARGDRRAYRLARQARRGGAAARSTPAPISSSGRRSARRGGWRCWRRRRPGCRWWRGGAAAFADIVEHGHTGILVPAGDARGFARRCRVAARRCFAAGV